MSFNGFLEYQEVNVLRAGEKGPLGIFFSGSDIEMSALRVQIYKHGTAGGSETLTVRAYNDEAFTKQVFESNTINLSDVVGASKYWIGWARFDFSKRVNLDSTVGYFFTLETSNYTRNRDIFYLGYCIDFVDAYSTNIKLPGSVSDPGKFEVFGFK